MKTGYDSGGNESALRLKAGESARSGKKIEGELLGKAHGPRACRQEKAVPAAGQTEAGTAVVTPKRYSFTKAVYEKDTQHLQARPSYRLAVTPW